MAKPLREGWSDEHNRLAVEAGFQSWEHWIVQLENELGRPICGALKPSVKSPCKAAASGNNGRCKNHGGLVPAGIASTSWKHGAYSQVFPTLPAQLFEAAERNYSDPELISLRKHIAVLEARTEELIGRLSTGESGSGWLLVGKMVEALSDAASSVEPATRAKIPTILGQLQMVVDRGMDDSRIWAEIQETMEMSRRLRMTEMDRLKNLKALMEAKRVKDLIGRILGIIKMHVSNVDELKSIARDIQLAFRSRSNGNRSTGAR